MENAANQKFDPKTVVQLRGEDKRKQVAGMFDRIAPNYDLMNLLISAGQTTIWRWRALGDVELAPRARVLDIGCGTGWVTRYYRKKRADLQHEAMDVSPEMLVRARALDPGGVYFEGDVCNLDVPDDKFDLVLTIYTTRNFPDIQKAVSEMLRVTRPGGRVLILDSFPPEQPTTWFRFQQFWMSRVVPVLVRPFSDPAAYSYLAASIENHLPADRVAELFNKLGASTTVTHYNFGAASRIVATKPSTSESHTL